MLSNLNWIDNAILFVFFISVIAGLMRGLIKEIISLLTWLAGFVIAVMFSPKLAGLFTGSPQVKSMISGATSSAGINTTQPVSVLSLGICFVILFVATLIVGSVINSLTSRAVERDGISFANRLLGSVFGFARGFLLVLVGVFLAQLSPIQQQPSWAQSQFVTAFQPAVQWLSRMIEPQLQNLKQKVDNTLQSGADKAQEMFQSE